MFDINTIENIIILVIVSIEAKAWWLNIGCPSEFSVNEAIPEFITGLKIKDRALTSCFSEKETHCYWNCGCYIFSTGKGGFAAFSFLWPQVLLLPLPPLCQADSHGTAVLGPPVPSILQLICSKKLYDHGIGTIAKQQAMIQKFETRFCRCTTSVIIFLHVFSFPSRNSNCFGLHFPSDFPLKVLPSLNLTLITVLRGQ